MSADERTRTRALLRHLYGDRHGYDTLPLDERAVAAVGSDAMYGELMPSAADRLFDALALGPKDELFDLGSGVGKVVLHAALSRPLRRAVGIEMMASRHDQAVEVLEMIERRDLLRTECCELWCGDFMRLPLTGATVVYTCSTAFPDALLTRLARRLRRLPKLRRFVSLRDLEDARGFEIVEVLRLDTSWKRRAPVWVYAPSA